MSPGTWFVAAVALVGACLLMYQTIRLIRAMVDAMKRQRLMYESIMEQQNAIRRLTHEKAEAQAMNGLAEIAELFPYTGKPSSKLEEKLELLDPRLRNFLQCYERVQFKETGTELSAQLLQQEKVVGDMMIVMRDWDHVFGVKKHDPVIYEIAGGKVIGDYPSIFHYILIGEGWD
ncbi:hypothetical protein DB346_20365 [Verrucomicrobia bacterium LW23]|nr:hypothetical protein DB346_20365 [Verrucomicrobia bacterium LW23]